MTVVDADVKAVIDTRRDTTPFIDTANLVVSEILVPASASSSSPLSQARLDKITIYLAAHLCFMADSGGLLSAKTGDAEEEYQPRYGEKATGLAASQFGKIAQFLDTTGTLASISTNNGLKARLTGYPAPQCPPPGIWLFW